MNFFAKIKKALCFKKKTFKLFEDERHVVDECNELNRVYVMYHDNVYDITEYMDQHPGGKEILQMSKGKIINK
eukprot:CAMPEP_0114589170 /NCGR_PEP_ID=MMETSP0125-20121206/11690_1 /TAXON_ID=485358 ORGANISM="Aristerostoma sp., Strain ATCC 50986" /NCGR_SAMPLE_ID=MMETSP0125 /ASSEMBLY_ACC=CAM_ASM_000245 /LENGTH=72 /DNA_ID=CAMNT_0001785933 /DNA_START=100 /DNA_END=318 /DNA_ORIENTATION=-